MTTVFVVCAAVGGTILACQVILTLFGLAGHASDTDLSGDVGHDLGGDFHGDAATDFHGVAGGDVHVDTGLHDAHGDHAAHPSASRVFGALSFRSVVAALTFFGLAGLTAEAAGAAPLAVLAVAVLAGAGAMYGVYRMMRVLYQLKAEGTARIQRTVGRPASVYLRIPGHQSGTGKIQINLQNRTMEYLAMTSGDELPTGARVEVVDVITQDTVLVQSVVEPERIEDA